MKELSIEQKAKRYDEAISIAREYDFSLTGVCAGDVIQDIFPELKESEDEKIRKWLIRTLKSLNNTPVQIDGAYEMMLPAIAWLEKQGEQKPAETEKGAKGNDREIPNSAWSEENEDIIEWLEKNIYMYNGECEGDRKVLINDIKQAMKDE